MHSQLNGLQVGESQNWFSWSSCAVQKNQCVPVQLSHSLCIQGDHIVTLRLDLGLGLLGLKSKKLGDFDGGGKGDEREKLGVQPNTNRTGQGFKNFLAL